MLLLKSVISLCEEVKKYHQKKACEHPGFFTSVYMFLKSSAAFTRYQSILKKNMKLT